MQLLARDVGFRQLHEAFRRERSNVEVVSYTTSLFLKEILG
jgi:hypothetical protein